MPTFILINLAEEMPTGVTLKVQNILIAKDRKRSFLARILGIGSTVVKRYDLISSDDTEINKFHATQPADGFGLDRDLRVEIVNECAKCDKIYLCAHGSSKDTGHVFAEKGKNLGSKHTAPLCTQAELSGFLKLILKPATPKPYNLTLIVCFAARSGDHDQTHDQDFLKDPEVLKTSLAYKLFKDLVDGKVNVRMTARLGEVRADENLDQILTQTEEGVLASLALQDKADLEQRLGRDVDDKRKYYLRLTPNPVFRKENELSEKFWLKAWKEADALRKAAKGEKAKYGKLIYQFLEGKLVITLKYPKPLELYHGPML